jgi:16S rRNA (guanine527-N7)-methyltransferase
MQQLFDRYSELLLKWNERFNLTAITDAEKIRTHHFDDSLAACPFVEDARSLIDLGTGGGFPGIPLKICLPELNVVVLDAKRKKIAFCQEVIRELGLTGIEAVHGRAEDPYLYRALGLFDVVISRAAWPLTVFLEIATAYYNESGTCIAMRGANWENEIKESEEIVKRHKLMVVETHPYTVGQDEQRALVIFKKKPLP